MIFLPNTRNLFSLISTIVLLTGCSITQPTNDKNENMQNSNTLEANDPSIEVIFSQLDSTLLLGGVLQLNASFENKGEHDVYLVIGINRAALRPDYYSFQATFGDQILIDPYADVNESGGIVGTVKIPAGEKYEQLLIVNEFLSLEDLRVDSSVDEIQLSIHYSKKIIFGSTDQEALFSSKSSVVEGTLQCTLVNDPDKLNQELDSLFTIVSEEENHSEEYEQSVKHFFSLRSNLKEAHLKQLLEHSNPMVKSRAEHTLSQLDSENE
ncbi:MAG: hypothetical protein AB8B56_01795 [Crocinitomicaceae bacterium]